MPVYRRVRRIDYDHFNLICDTLIDPAFRDCPLFCGRLFALLLRCGRPDWRVARWRQLNLGGRLLRLRLGASIKEPHANVQNNNNNADDNDDDDGCR